MPILTKKPIVLSDYDFDNDLAFVQKVQQKLGYKVQNRHIVSSSQEKCLLESLVKCGITPLDFDEVKEYKEQIIEKSLEELGMSIFGKPNWAGVSLRDCVNDVPEFVLQMALELCGLNESFYFVVEGLRVGNSGHLLFSVKPDAESCKQFYLANWESNI